MKKLLISLAFVLGLLALVAHGALLFRFSGEQPRLEIIFQGAVPPQVQELLKGYGLQQSDNMLIVKGDGQSVFLASEIADVLAQNGIEGFGINDRTQAWRLAKQSVEIYVFALEFIGVLLFLRWLVRDIKKALYRYREGLKKAYSGELLKANVETVLMLSIKWILLFIAVIFLGARLIAFEFYVPPQLLPPQYILDFGYYFSMKTGTASPSEYEQLCATAIPALYALCAINIAFASLLSAKLWRKLK